MEEQLGDRQVRSGGLLGQKRVDVLGCGPGSGVPVREGRHRNADLFALRLHTSRAGKTGDHGFAVGHAFGLHSVDELNEFGGAVQIAQERLALLRALRRIAPERQEAADARVEKFTDQHAGFGVRGTHTREVGHGVHVGVRQDIAQHIER